MALDDELPRLECGRTVDEVWIGIAGGPDEHEQRCPHCQAARLSLGRLQAAIEAEQRLPPQSDNQPGAGVKEGIMGVVRAEVRQGRRIDLEAPADGMHSDDAPALAITEHALAEVVRRVADELPDIRARRVKSETVPSPQVTIEPPADGDLEPATVRIGIGVSVRADAPISQATQRLRDRIIDGVAAQVGIRVGAVDITVEDVHDA